MTERRQQLVVDRDELREIMLEVMSSKLPHHCRLSEEERTALKNLSVFLQRVESTKWSFFMVVVTIIASSIVFTVWEGIKVSLRK